MALNINIIIPGKGQLFIPIWRALEAQAAISVACHGHTESSTVLKFVAKQFREAVPSECMGITGATGTWEDAWRAAGDLEQAPVGVKEAG